MIKLLVIFLKDFVAPVAVFLIQFWYVGLILLAALVLLAVFVIRHMRMQKAAVAVS